MSRTRFSMGFHAEKHIRFELFALDFPHLIEMGERVGKRRFKSRKERFVRRCRVVLLQNVGIAQNGSQRQIVLEGRKRLFERLRRRGVRQGERDVHRESGGLFAFVLHRNEHVDVAARHLVAYRAADDVLVRHKNFGRLDGYV